MHRFVLVLAIFALSCGNTARPDYVVHLVNASSGGLPFGSCNGDLQVDVQQSTNPVLTTHGTLTAGNLSALSVEIPSYGLLTEIQVTANCADGTQLIGATPRFFPVGYGFIDIVLGQPSTCVKLAAPTLISGRRAPHLLTLGANVIVVGGLEPGMSPSQRVQALDSLTLTSTSSTTAMLFDALPLPGVGLGGAAVLGDTTFVTVSDSNSIMFFDAGPNVTTRVTNPRLHPGATSDSAVLNINGTVAVVGGTATTGISWIDSTGAVTFGELQFARQRPAAVAVGENLLLVVGGQAMGENLFELMRVGSTSREMSTPFGPTDEVRYAPVATASASRSFAWVGLGNTEPDESGAIVTTSWEIGRCVASSHMGCDVAPGPSYPDPRSHVAVVEHHVGVVGMSGIGAYETLVFGGTDPSGMPSTLIDRIQLDAAGHATIGAFDVMRGGLPAARTDVGATDIGSGIVLVAGGVDDADNPQQDVNICFPAALRPITE